VKDLNRLKMAHAILVNQKEMATHVARDIYCARIQAGKSASAEEVVEVSEEIIQAINTKYDDRILAAEKDVTDAMQELQELQAKMQKGMQGPGGKILRVPGCSGLDGCSH